MSKMMHEHLAMTSMTCGECRASSNATGQTGQVLFYRRRRAVRRYSGGGRNDCVSAVCVGAAATDTFGMTTTGVTTAAVSGTWVPGLFDDGASPPNPAKSLALTSTKTSQHAASGASR